MSRLALASVVLAVLLAPASAQNDLFANRPAFAGPEQPAQRFARCEELRAMAADLDAPDTRIDLWVEGALTLVKSDGALWYLVMCGDLRVMCVTYEGNDMQVGDKVYFKGGYRRLDANHAVLDPCLANREAE